MLRQMQTSRDAPCPPLPESAVLGSSLSTSYQILIGHISHGTAQELHQTTRPRSEVAWGQEIEGICLRQPGLLGL